MRTTFRHQPLTGEATQLRGPEDIRDGMLIEVTSIIPGKPTARKYAKTIGALFVGTEAGETSIEAARRTWLTTDSLITPIWRGVVSSHDESSAKVNPVVYAENPVEREVPNAEGTQHLPAFEGVEVALPILYQDLGLTAIQFVDPNLRIEHDTARDIGRWAPLITREIVSPLQP